MIDLSLPEVKFALNAVREVSKLAKQIQSEMTAEELTKGDCSPVTVGDFSAQAYFGHLIENEFLGDVVVGEENSEALKTVEAKPVLKQVMSFVKRFISNAGEKDIFKWIDLGTGRPGVRFWTLDPIDGTKGFLRGEQYAVAGSLIENYEVKLAVIGCPNLSEECEVDVGGHGSIVLAVKGGGAWIGSLDEENHEFKRMHVSERNDLKEAKIMRSVVAAHTNSSRTQKFLTGIGNEEEPIYMDSMAKHVLLSAGVGDSFFYLLPRDKPDFRMKIWDVAPGSLVIEEAGGQISDLEGGAIDFSQGLTVARSGSPYDQ